MARQGRARPVRQQPKTILQPLGDLRHAQRAGARGRQLNCQRNAVQPRTYFRYDGTGRLRESKPRLDSDGSLREEPNGFKLTKRFQ